MRFFSPMTLIVVVGLAVCLAAGVWLLLRAGNSAGNAGSPTCPGCGQRNRRKAKFCAHCGASL